MKHASASCFPALEAVPISEQWSEAISGKIASDKMGTADNVITSSEHVNTFQAPAVGISNKVH